MIVCIAEKPSVARDIAEVLSIGRVQTPTLALIVNRQLEIANFQPKQYWELKTN